MRNHRNFWDRNAGRYDRFMRKDRAAYEEMYALIRPVVKAKTVLELATGTGLIAKHIVNAAAHIEATDASAEMILEAKRDNQSAKLHFSVQDMFRLPYADKSFDVVIVSNALHIVPQPEKALDEIRRVLKDGGVLIAPTFTHAGNSFSGKVKAFFMKLVGFPLNSRWSSADYRMRASAKERTAEAFRNSFGLPTDPFPTLLASAVSPFAFWYEDDPAGGCIRFPTERECERLMGLPEGWTKYGADSEEILPAHRYRALGNAIALPCAEYIMRGIYDVLTRRC